MVYARAAAEEEAKQQAAAAAAAAAEAEAAAAEGEGSWRRRLRATVDPAVYHPSQGEPGEVVDGKLWAGAAAAPLVRTRAPLATRLAPPPPLGGTEACGGLRRLRRLRPLRSSTGASAAFHPQAAGWAVHRLRGSHYSYTSPAGQLVEEAVHPRPGRHPICLPGPCKGPGRSHTPRSAA